MEEDMEHEVQLSGDQLKKLNCEGLMNDNLIIRRQPLIPRLLQVSDVDAVLRRAFKSPLQGAPDRSSELSRRLASRKRFVPWGSSTPAPRLLFPQPMESQDSLAGGSLPQVQSEAPPGVEPLVLWEPGDGAAEGAKPIVVDSMLLTWLRQHQREGVQFMFECVAGLKEYGGQGCILADDMGLGKTLQGITLLWTLLTSGFDVTPMAKRVVIVCPTSLVNNWDSECNKFLKGRVKTLPLSESSRADVIDSIKSFLSIRPMHQVLIVSYETFRIHSDSFSKEGSCDLLICDEAHRLKNGGTQTNQALDKLPCKRRVLLSGTPLQNDLGEFYAMISFCNPGVLGTVEQFNKYYAAPILRAREPDASEADRTLGQDRSKELSSFVNQFILRRTNSLLSDHLPPKVVAVVCCRLSALQEAVYLHLLSSKAAKAVESGRTAQVLTVITVLRKLCNHPKLIYDMLRAGGGGSGTGSGVSTSSGDDSAGLAQECHHFFPPGLLDAGTARGGRAGGGAPPPGWELLGGKFAFLAKMLAYLYQHTDDRIVIVSNFTQTLELVAALCRERGYTHVSLNGSTSMKKRKKLVESFNDPNSQDFVFLLSSKAGGCGLNLIGGNRLVLFDPDWNPANDKQAAARVWRDGQKKRVFVYRLLATGTLEEKVFQRQISKEGLKSAVSADSSGETELVENMLSASELRKLFTYRGETSSDCHDGLKCSGCDNGEDLEENGEDPTAGEDRTTKRREQAQIGKPSEEELKLMGHHSSVSTVPDQVMQKVGVPEVSFVFTCEVDGKPLDPDIEAGPKRTHANRLGISRISLSRRSEPHPTVRGSPLGSENKPPQRMSLTDSGKSVVSMTSQIPRRIPLHQIQGRSVGNPGQAAGSSFKPMMISSQKRSASLPSIKMAAHPGRLSHSPSLNGTIGNKTKPLAKSKSRKALPSKRAKKEDEEDEEAMCESSEDEAYSSEASLDSPNNIDEDEDEGAFQ